MHVDADLMLLCAETDSPAGSQAPTPQHNRGGNRPQEEQQSGPPAHHLETQGEPETVSHLLESPIHFSMEGQRIGILLLNAY